MRGRRPGSAEEWPAAAAPRLPERQAERGVATPRPPNEGRGGAATADCEFLLWGAGEGKRPPGETEALEDALAPAP
eukprot:6455442-Alexandrium_andersonii.AAC.1